MIAWIVTLAAAAAAAPAAGGLRHAHSRVVAERGPAAAAFARDALREAGPLMAAVPGLGFRRREVPGGGARRVERFQAELHGVPVRGFELSAVFEGAADEPSIVVGHWVDNAAERFDRAALAAVRARKGGELAWEPRTGRPVHQVVAGSVVSLYDALDGTLLEEYDAQPTLVEVPGRRLRGALHDDAPDIPLRRGPEARLAEAAQQHQQRRNATTLTGQVQSGQGMNELGEVISMQGLVSNSSTTRYELISGTPRVVTHDFGNRASNGPGGFDPIVFELLLLTKSFGPVYANEDNVWDDDSAAVSIQDYLYKTINYLEAQFKVDFMHLLGIRELTAMAHVGGSFFNAFYLGHGQIGFGDGANIPGFGHSRAVVAGDVSCHEITHGVTDSTSGLVYSHQAGALNEAGSDQQTVFFEASVVKPEDANAWYLIGEDIFTFNYFLRSMADPTATYDPSHVETMYHGKEDNGGVHTNSSVINHWYYLLINGGKNADPQFASQHGVTVTVPLDRANRLVTEVLVTLPSDATFCTYRQAVVAHTVAYETEAAEQAFDEVGITAVACGL